MKSISSVLLTGIFYVLSIGVAGAVDAMDQKAMEAIIINKAESHKGGGGFLEFDYRGVSMMVVSDITHDRMRIVTPVAKYDELSQSQIDKIMQANFHSALDARYAVSSGVLFSAYIHPLSPLTREMIESAMAQVANLARSFGTEYSSGALTFRGGQ
ncbi:MAG TPA: hypothetical protein ENI64_05185 [Gammaproteobacteria bacterium]|nr:hypothetical protein [Gammaproteobacteria bacterium]